MVILLGSQCLGLIIDCTLVACFNSEGSSLSLSFLLFVMM